MSKTCNPQPLVLALLVQLPLLSISNVIKERQKTGIGSFLIEYGSNDHLNEYAPAPLGLRAGVGGENQSLCIYFRGLFPFNAP